jgi:hypothetical protein
LAGREVEGVAHLTIVQRKQRISPANDKAKTTQNQLQLGAIFSHFWFHSNEFGACRGTQAARNVC